MSTLVEHISGARIVIDDLHAVGNYIEAAPSKGTFAILSRYILDYEGGFVLAVLAEVEPRVVVERLLAIDEDERKLRGIETLDDVTLLSCDVLSDICVLLFDTVEFKKNDDGVTVDEKGLAFTRQYDRQGMCAVDPDNDFIFGLFAYITPDNKVIEQHST